MLRVLAFCAIAAVAFAVSLAASGGAAVIAADPSPQAKLPPQAEVPFQRYLEEPHWLGYRAFVVEPETGAWAKSTENSRPGIAVDRALAGCRRRSLRDCRLFAVGDIIVLGLADWKTEVAVVLYRVEPGAGNGDLEAVTAQAVTAQAVTAQAVTSGGGGAEVAALRRSLLHAAAEMGRSGAVAAMLDRGVDVDAGSEVGATALSYAASRGHREVVALLLARGAAVNARNGVGKTALGVALLANNFTRARDTLAADHDAVIRLILEAGGTE